MARCRWQDSGVGMAQTQGEARREGDEVGSRHSADSVATRRALLSGSLPRRRQAGRDRDGDEAMTMKPYNPLSHSLVQAMHGVWSEYEADDFVEALLQSILEEIKRVHWNVYQHEWDSTYWGDSISDPEIPGLYYSRWYTDHCDCGGIDNDRSHEPNCVGLKPNFQFEDVEFRWYKRPGRGMSTNKNMTSDDWRQWFQRCIDKIRDFDVKHLDESDQARCESLRASLRSRFPNEF